MLFFPSRMFGLTYILILTILWITAFNDKPNSSENLFLHADSKFICITYHFRDAFIHMKDENFPNNYQYSIPLRKWYFVHHFIPKNISRKRSENSILFLFNDNYFHICNLMQSALWNFCQNLNSLKAKAFKSIPLPSNLKESSLD